MSTPARRIGALLIVVIAVAVAAGVAVVAAPRWNGGGGGTFGVEGVRIRTTVDPRGSLVGDRVTATADVLVDTDRVDPETVQVKPRFGPFGLVSSSRTIDTGIGSAAHVRFRYQLQCVTVDCLYAMEKVEGGRTLSRPITFPQTDVTAVARDGSAARAPVTWPAINLRSRLDQRDVDLVNTAPAAFRTPGTTYRLPPSAVGWVAVVVGIALLLVGTWLVAKVVHGRRATRELRIPDHLTGVDRALALVEHARENGDEAGERRALERLAAELRDDGDFEGSEAARRLAWSKDGLEDDEIASLRELVGARDAR